MADIKSIIETVYFMCGPILVIIAGIGLKQLKIAKDTSRLNAKRESLSLAADRCSHYLSDIIPLIDELDVAIEKNNIKFFSLYETSVVGESVKVSTKHSKASVLNELKKMSNLVSKSVRVYNALESFSVFFTNGVADEKVAYSSVGKTFCFSVNKYMPEIIQHAGPGKYYNNILTLYLIWQTRANSDTLKRDQKEIEEKLFKIHDKFIKPVGTDE